ncbi:serine hydrolase domain-containing protein [Halobaculum sp. MBLA0147]|uniref:serine hydrolase domain-containing protein n=1 Tax=Halobaculum sp. MBLA0147 TaxID=3079934 RepID=UPI0035251EB7
MTRTRRHDTDAETPEESATGRRAFLAAVGAGTTLGLARPVTAAGASREGTGVPVASPRDGSLAAGYTHTGAASTRDSPPTGASHTRDTATQNLTTTPDGTASVGERVDAAQIRAHLDDLLPAALDEHDVPGATAAVVAGADTVTAGYGFVDRASETPVDAEQTVFRVGSVSKPFVATAVMDQIQRGNLAPDDPITSHLDVPVDDYRGEVATIAELATHRGGFEATNRGMWITDHDAFASLPTYLREHPHACVRPPGRVGSYANFGYALLGQVLAATRDAPFHEAIDATLLRPAGMDRSSFRQPLPDPLERAHATSHASTGTYPDGTFPLLGLTPAGSLSTTAPDAARFLRLHLNDGVLDGSRVLAPGTVAATHEQWATHHEELSGTAFGLFEEFRGDVRILSHNGATVGFYSYFAVVPESDVGLFLAFDAPAGGAAAGDVVDELFAELFPTNSESNATSSDSDSEPTNGNASADSADATPTPVDSPTPADALTGTYRSLRQSYTSYDRLFSVLDARSVTVDAAGDGTLETTADGETDTWIEIEPRLFEHVDENRRIAFGDGAGDTDDVTTAQYLFCDGGPTALGRVDGTDRLSLHGAVGGLAALGGLGSLVGWPLAAAWRHTRGDEPESDSTTAEEPGDRAVTGAESADGTAAAASETEATPDESPGTETPDGGAGGAGDASPDESDGWRGALRERSTRVKALAAGGYLAALAGLAGLLAHFAVDPLTTLSTPSVTFQFAFAGQLVGLVAAAGAVAGLAHVWRSDDWGVVGRLSYTVVTASLVGFYWLLWYWNLLVPPI